MGNESLKDGVLLTLAEYQQLTHERDAALAAAEEARLGRAALTEAIGAIRDVVMSSLGPRPSADAPLLVIRRMADDALGGRGASGAVPLGPPVRYVGPYNTAAEDDCTACNNIGTTHTCGAPASPRKGGGGGRE